MRSSKPVTFDWNSFVVVIESALSKMIDTSLSQSRDYLADTNSQTPQWGALPPAIIGYRCFAQGVLTRQLLIFESAPSFSNAFQGKGTALVELVDGRIFFFRTSLAVMRDDPAMSALINELHRLPIWIKDWKTAAGFVGYMIGITFEFIDKNPSKIESWSIPEWRQQAVSWLAINQPMITIQQVRVITSAGTDELSGELSIKLAEFVEALGQSAYYFLGEHHCSWQARYNYFTSGSEQQRRYRRQAGMTFPLFIQQLFACPKDDSTTSIIQAIDEGVPLVEYMAKLFNCPKKCVRHLVGFRFEDIGIQWIGRLKELLMILGSLDVNRLPKSEHEWNVFGETVDLLSAMTRIPTTSLSSRLLLGELSKLNWRRKIDSNVGFRERALAIERFAENFRQAIVTTAWVNGNNCGSVQRLVIEAVCSLGLSRLERLARKWRAEEMRLDSESIIQQTNGFPMILANPLEVGDMKVIQLTKHTDLTSEGARMGNCVGNYAGSCASGSAYIFSVRDSDGASCVTVEFRLEQSPVGLPELNFIQQEGYKNSTPDSRYDEALSVLQRYTTSPMVRKKLLDLVVYRKVWEKGGSGMAVKYIRSLKFIQFLKIEDGSRLDFETLVAEAIRREDATAS